VRKVTHELRDHKLVELATSCGLPWLESMIAGKIPTLGLTRNPIASKCVNFGTVETIGVANRTYDLPIIRPTKQSQEEMFKLPDESLEGIRQRQHRLDTAQYADRDARVSFKKPKRKKIPNLRKKVGRRLFSSQASVDEENKKN